MSKSYKRRVSYSDRHSARKSAKQINDQYDYLSTQEIEDSLINFDQATRQQQQKARQVR